MRRFRPWQIAAAAAAVALLALLVWFLILRKPAAPSDTTPPPSALVTLTPLRQSAVAELVNAYGVIAGSAAASRTLAAPRAVIVAELLVTPGEPVASGAPLVVLTNTPATVLAYRQTTAAVDFAQSDLARVQRLYDQHLATNDQRATARKTLADAQAAAAAQVAAGAGDGRQTLAAPSAGVVGSVAVKVGDHVAADTPLLTLIASGGLVAQLGVEPTHAGRLAAGQAVALASPFDATRTTQSRLSVVGRQVDPASRLVTVTAPVSGAGLPLGAAVEGHVTVGSHPGYLVPEGSVVHDEGGAHIFTVSGGKAREVSVTAGDVQGVDVEVSGALTAGEPVVVEGAYQLQDGMAVRTRPR
ncbi:MAG: efflux RND transporter periplasmic adaptor subunit [Caulobacteraceae bacterium]